jgi:hypothetical protein
MSSLPLEVLDLVEFDPLEDLVLSLLRLKFAVVPVRTLISSDQEFPFILLRRGDEWGRWDGDPRFISTGVLRVNTFAEGPEADKDAALLGEAVRVALTGSLNVVTPSGHLTKVDPISLPIRRPDWATATGPVQYADLPSGVARYEAIYELAYRRVLP